MNTTLRRLLRRLDDQLLEHLRAHCVEQAARIDEMEAGTPLNQVGVTRDGRVVRVPTDPERTPA